jgi:hypothetical protein
VNDTDSRVAFWAVWGVGTLVAYSLILIRRARHYRNHRDPRAFRDAVESLGYFLVSIGAFLGITFALFTPGAGHARLLFAVAAGAFLVVGLYTVAETEPSDGAAGKARRQ